MLVLTILLTAVAAQQRPELNLDFSATSVMEVNGRQMTRRFALSQSKSMVKTDTEQPQFDKDIMQITDCRAQVELQIQPFFNSTICYKTKMHMPNGVGPDKCFLQFANQIVPTSMYANTKLVSTTNGVQLWRHESDLTRSIPYYPTPDKQYIIKVRDVMKWDYYLRADGIVTMVEANNTQVISGKPGMKPGEKQRSSQIQKLTFSKITSPAPAKDFEYKGTCVPMSDRVSQMPAGRVNDPNLLGALSHEKLTWEAGFQENLDGMTFKDVATRLGTHMRELRLPLKERDADFEATAIPAHFDARLQWSECSSIGRIRNQGNCGSCWAFGATESLEDRFCIASKGKIQPWLSPEYITDCDKHDGGCQGGFLDNAWNFLVGTGVPMNTCDPYEHCAYPPFPNCTKPRDSFELAEITQSDRRRLQMPPGGKCPTKCADNKPLARYTAKTAYAVASPGDTPTMQREIMKYGPIEVAFFVYNDFMQYRSGIYQKSASAQGPMGGHAVKILGWGVGDDEKKTPYWIVANSWSPNWGEKGYFRIIRGTNECGIETQPAAGHPNLAEGAPVLSL